jgi:hypothetical protein
MDGLCNVFYCTSGRKKKGQGRLDTFFSRLPPTAAATAKQQKRKAEEAKKKSAKKGKKKAKTGSGKFRR